MAHTFEFTVDIEHAIWQRWDEAAEAWVECPSAIATRAMWDLDGRRYLMVFNRDVIHFAEVTDPPVVEAPAEPVDLSGWQSIGHTDLESTFTYRDETDRQVYVGADWAKPFEIKLDLKDVNREVVDLFYGRRWTTGCDE